MAVDIRKYEFAPIGIEYLKAEDIRSAKISLDKLVEGFGLNDDQKVLLEGTSASKEGIIKALSIYRKKYLESIKDASLDDFWNIYQEEFEDGEKRVYHAKLAPFASKKLQEMEDEIKTREDKLKDVMDNNTPLSDTEIQNLNAELNKYREAYNIMKTAQEIRKNSLQAKVYADAKKEENKELKGKMRGVVGI